MQQFENIKTTFLVVIFSLHEFFSVEAVIPKYVGFPTELVD